MNVLEYIAMGIRVQTTYITHKYEYQGNTYVFAGKCVSFIDLSIPTIEILSSDSKPNDTVLDPKAEELIHTQFARLIEEGGKFYTALRADWCIPMIEWRLENPAE